MAGVYVIAVPTLVASCLSFLATSIFGTFHVLVPPPDCGLRHYLVINLLFSDFANSLNNTISGIATLKALIRGETLTGGSACTANAYIGQLTVQATDFNILLISIVVLRIILNKHLPTRPTKAQTALFVLLPWLPPMITAKANVALALHAYGPTSGNWCWIAPEHKVLRYALTHSWRIAIFVATVAIYTYVYIRVLGIYGKVWTQVGSSRTRETEEESELRPLPGHVNIETTVPNGQSASTAGKAGGTRLCPESEVKVLHVREEQSDATNVHARRKKELRNFFLLNGYPILWVILWIPGMANRATELTGSSPVWLQALQATTQLVGIANSLTYAFNESVFRRYRRWLSDRTGFSRM